MINSVTHTLDARGLKCPLPVLKLRKRLAALQDGEAVRLLTDDPAAIIDVPHFCHESGARLIEDGRDDGALFFIVQKPGPKKVESPPASR